MKRLSSRLRLAALAAGGLLCAAAPAPAAAIYGGGSALPFALYHDAWFRQFNGGTAFPSCNPAVTTCIAYAAVGSGAGTAAFLSQQSPGGTLPSAENMFIPYDAIHGYGIGPEFWDFSASDAVLTPAQLTAYASTGPLSARGPAIQVPAVASPVAIAFNATGLTIHPARAVPPGPKTTIGGSSKLYLSRRAYCGIFTGQITNWNNPILTEDNLGMPLATTLPIRVVVPQQSSSTTLVLTRHLEAACNGAVENSHPSNPGTLADYDFGIGTTVSWPSQTATSWIRATGSDGVAAAVKAQAGSIGYLSADYTAQAATPQIVAPPPAANLQTHDSAAAGEHADAVKPIPPAPTYVQNGIDSFVAPALDTTPPLTNAENWGLALNASPLHDPVDDTASPVDPANPQAYPISGFTNLLFYSCYFPASETLTIRSFITAYTGGGAYDTAARDRDLAPLTSTIKAAIRGWATSPGIAGIRTGPVAGTCTIASGT